MNLTEGVEPKTQLIEVPLPRQQPTNLRDFDPYITSENPLSRFGTGFSLEQPPVSDLVGGKVKTMHKRRTEEIFLPYSILASGDAVYNCQITDFERSASTCMFSPEKIQLLRERHCPQLQLFLCQSKVLLDSFSHI